jgi:hypothetical protein
MTLGIAAYAPVQGGGAARGVEPLAPTLEVAPNLPSAQPVTFSIRLIITRPPQADMPQLFVS